MMRVEITRVGAPVNGKALITGTITGAPLFWPHPADTSAGPWLAETFFAQILQDDWDLEVSWVTFTGTRTDTDGAAQMSIHLPLNPELRIQRCIHNDVPVWVERLAGLLPPAYILGEDGRAEHFIELSEGENA